MLQQERAQRQQLEAQVAALQAAMSEQSAALGELRGDREALRRQLSRLKALEQENAALSSKLQAATNERRQLLSKLDGVQARVAELQQSYVSLASACDDGLDRRDILRRSRVEGMLRDAAAGGGLEVELAAQQLQQQQGGSLDRGAGAFSKASSAMAALTRERDMLQQRVQELSGRLAEAVEREGAARGAQALRNASWKRSATQAETRLAAALKRIKELAEELRKRDNESKARDRYIAQLERTVMTQHRSLQQQRRVLREGGPAAAARPAPDGRRNSPVSSGGGPSQAAGAARPPSRDGVRSAVPSTALRANPGAVGAARAGSNSVGTRLTWPDSSTAEAGQPSGSQQRHQGVGSTTGMSPGQEQARAGWDARSRDDPSRAMRQGEELDGSVGRDFQQFLAASLARVDALRADDADTDPWSPPRLPPSVGERSLDEDGEEQGRDQDCKESREASGLESPRGADLTGGPLEAWLPGTEEQTSGGGVEPGHGRSATPPAVLHQQLTSVEASLAMLYQELQEFKDASRPRDPGPESPVPSPALRPHHRSLALQLSWQGGGSGTGDSAGGLSSRMPATSLPVSPKRTPYEGPHDGFDSADGEQLLAASRLLPRDESPLHTFSPTASDEHTAGYSGEGGISYSAHDADGGDMLTPDGVWLRAGRSQEGDTEAAAGPAPSSSVETAQRLLPAAAAGTAGARHSGAWGSGRSSASVSTGRRPKGAAGEDSEGGSTVGTSAGQHHTPASVGTAHSGGAKRRPEGQHATGHRPEPDEEPRQPLPMHMLSHVLCCALPAPAPVPAAAEETAFTSSAPAAAAGGAGACSAVGSGVATLQQLLRPGAPVERGPPSAPGSLPAHGRAAAHAESPRVSGGKPGLGSGGARVPAPEPASASTTVGRSVRSTPSSGAPAGTPRAERSQCDSAPGSRGSYAARSLSRLGGRAEAPAASDKGPGSDRDRASAAAAPPSARQHQRHSSGSGAASQQPRVAFGSSLERHQPRHQPPKAPGSSAVRGSSRVEASPVRAAAESAPDSPPASPGAASPISTLLANLSKEPADGPPSERGSGGPAAPARAGGTTQGGAPSDAASRAPAVRHNGTQRRSHEGATELADDKRQAHGGDGDERNGSNLGFGSAASEPHRPITTANGGGRAGMDARDGRSLDLQAEPSFSHSRSRHESAGSTQHSVSRHQAGQAAPRSSVASNSMAVSQGPAADSDGAVASRPTLSGWLGGPRSAGHFTGIEPQHGGGVKPRDGGAAAGLDSAVTALQRLREQRLQRHQQPQQWPRSQPLPPQALQQAPYASQQRPGKQTGQVQEEGGQLRGAASGGARREQQAGDTGEGEGVMVLTLRGSMHGEVLVSPRHFSAVDAALLPGAGGTGDDNGIGGDGAADGKGLTLRLEVSSRPASGAVLAARQPPAKGQELTQQHTSSCSLQTLRDAMRLKAASGAGAGSVDGEEGDASRLAAGDAGAARGSEKGAAPLSSVQKSDAGVQAAQEWEPTQPRHRYGEAGDGTSGARGGGFGRRGTEMRQPSEHPLMQLLGQASADLQLLNNRLKPFVGDRS